LVRLTDQQPLSSVAEILMGARWLGAEAWDNTALTSMTESEIISFVSKDVQDFFTLLAQRHIPYVLVGGVALLRYIEGRNTRDIDLLLSIQSFKKIPEFTIVQEDRPVIRAIFRKIPVDLLLTEDPLFKLVSRSYATTHRFQEVAVPCATVEGLLLLKLYALPSLYRQGNTQRIALYETDILMLLDRHPVPTEPLLQILAPFIDEGAVVELRKIIDDIRARIARTKQTKTN
jgi:hypothetical protein